jgi:hypothetical protein
VSEKVTLQVSKTSFHRHKHGTHTLEKVLRNEGFTFSGVMLVNTAYDELVSLSDIRLSARPKPQIALKA